MFNSDFKQSVLHKKKIQKQKELGMQFMIDKYYNLLM